VRVALDAGADAVYVGLEGWSRGGSRGELTWDELKDAQRVVLSAGRSLHLALNIIPRTTERALLLERIPAIIDLGIEEIIVNDIGILATLKQRFASLRLTTSIGCGARTVSDVAFFKDIGADAVVLPATVDPTEVSEIRSIRGIAIEVMVHMVDEFVLLGKCFMPSYLHLKPSPLPSSGGVRQTGSMKRGGVGVCFRHSQQAWDVYDGERHVDSRLFPSRQISRIGDVQAYAEAGVDVFKLHGRSLPVELLGPLVRRYRDAIDGSAALQGSGDAVLPAAWAVAGR
jgi:putative protease